MNNNATKAVQDVLAERQRQITKEGWTTAHDDAYYAGDLSKAASVYALVGSSDGRVIGDELSPSITQMVWPWEWHWFKPRDRRYNLVRAAALLLAEIERLDRASEKQAQTPPRQKEFQCQNCGEMNFRHPYRNCDVAVQP
jgi:hypothetical protein